MVHVVHEYKKGHIISRVMCMLPDVEVEVSFSHEPLTRYMKLQVTHVPGMPGTFSPPPTSKETSS